MQLLETAGNFTYKDTYAVPPALQLMILDIRYMCP